MRLTVLINGSDSAVNSDFALVWIDLDQQRWSRESHAGVDLPSWGDVHSDGEETILSAPHDSVPLCVMRGLCVDNRQEFDSGHGEARWSDERSRKATAWQWRLQAVDRNSIRAADSVFAG